MLVFLSHCISLKINGDAVAGYRRGAAAQDRGKEIPIG